jgi:transposase
LDRIREGSNGRGDLRAGDDGELGGSPAGVAPNQLFTWRRLVAQGSLTAAGSGEEVVPASDYRALQNQVRELHRLLGKKTLEAEILKEALEHATSSKKQLRLPPLLPKDDTR